MGKYNFDAIIDRTHTKSLKYDFAVRRGRPADIKPFWVADMDFEVPPELKQILLERVNHGVFGYTESDEEYFDTVANWFTTRFNWTPDINWLVKTPGIVMTLAMAVQVFTKEGEGVLIQQPVYYPFSEVIEDNDRRLINAPLVRGDDKYTIDFEAFEKAIIENNVTLFMLCNPHNPVGRVWTEEELRTLGDICIKHNVIIISDEIHADFVWEGHTHHVFASLDGAYADHSIICTSPSKTFNIAGLQISNIFIPNPSLRRRFRKQVATAGYSQVGTMGLVGAEGAYRVGAPWLDELKVYIQANIEFTVQYFAEHMPKIKVYKPEGTYLIWFDCSGLGMTAAEREQWLWHDAKLWLDSGAIFGDDGKDFERINVACPRATLVDGLESLKAAYDTLGL